MPAILNIQGEITDSGELRVEIPPGTPKGKVVLTLITPDTEDTAEGKPPGALASRHSQPVRVCGRLEGIRRQDHHFELLLSSGDLLWGTAPALALREYGPLVGEKVVVAGRATFEDSGNLRTLEASLIEPASAGDVLWSEVPKPVFPELDHESLARAQTPTSGVGSILGQWPGAESDDEIFAALEELS